MADHKNNYIEVQISFNKNNYENICSELYLNGIENILEEEGALKLYFSENEKEKIESLKKILVNKKIIGEDEFTAENYEGKNWNEAWEESIEPVYISDKIVVYPSWKKSDVIAKAENGKDRILIEIDPKMSFGTGHNETTQLVLELMADYIEGNEEKLLDFGTGTGILSIAGIKLGVNSATAIDTDNDSIENAGEYFVKNNVHEKINLLNSDITELEEDSFDVICANIIRSVIIDRIEHISEKLNINGKLFISGVLLSEDQEVLEYLTQFDFEIIDISSKAEWIGIYAVKR
ncbi:MAG TPA: 50S ribosomal protein L11 methyltransferase [Ignavibacteria bacterium]|nr:50S ribosomal protein L11 methyltransferase [Ignavibacteria bacterium]HMR39542.1 50S ribosomal protein L11 methyltransferase [Ignavibacteria bacterium]